MSPDQVLPVLQWLAITSNLSALVLAVWDGVRDAINCKQV